MRAYTKRELARRSLQNPAMNSLPTEVMENLGAFFARKQPDLTTLSAKGLLDNGDKSYRELSATCRAAHDACKSTIETHMDEAQARFDRFEEIEHAREECEIQESGHEAPYW